MRKAAPRPEQGAAAAMTVCSSSKRSEKEIMDGKVSTQRNADRAKIAGACVREMIVLAPPLARFLLPPPPAHLV
jgi:hypothetical protein